MTIHKTGTREEWLAARFELLKAEKELTRRSDGLARRQEPPWVRIACGQVLQSYISSSLFHPFEAPAHRRIMHTQVRRDLVQPIAMLLVRLKDATIVALF